MPANLTPEYERAERQYRQAGTDAERVAALQEMLAAIPKHKGTEKMQGDLKRRLSQLRKAEHKSNRKGPDPFHIPKGGAGQIVLIGPPNTGKSTLLAVTTHADAKVADYPFTTSVPLPGIWQHDDIQLELVDTPPIIPERIPPGLLGTIHDADVVGIMVEASEAGLDQVEMVLGVLKTNGLVLRSVPRHQLPPLDSGQRPGLIIANKLDTGSPEILETLSSLYGAPGIEARLTVVGISARLRQGLDGLFARLWELLAQIRVYAKEPGRPPDLHKPFVLPIGATVAELARQIHRDLPEQMRFARLWGHSRFEGQQVHKTEILQDHDVVEIHE